MLQHMKFKKSFKEIYSTYQADPDKYIITLHESAK